MSLLKGDKMKARRYVILALIAITVCMGGVLARVVSEPKDVLAGLGGMYVVVEDFDLGAEEAGLTEEKVRGDVELQLRLAGIKVLSAEEGLATKSKAFLYVTVTTVKGELHQEYAGSVEVSLRERVYLAREPETMTLAATWDKISIGLGSSDIAKSKIRESIKDLVDEFINDYLAANQKTKVEAKP